MAPKTEAEKLAELQRLTVGLQDDKRVIRALFYAPPGMGKTTLAGTVIEEILAVEGGRFGLMTTDSAWPVLLKSEKLRASVDRIPFPGLNLIPTILKAHQEGVEPYASWKGLLWDTVSTAVSDSLRKLVKAKAKPLVAGGPPRLYKGQEDPEVEAWPHYRIIEGLLKEQIQLLNRSGLHIIYTAHEKKPSEAETQKTGSYAIRPNMPEACYNVVAQEVSLIGWLQRVKADEPRKLQVVPTNTVTAKTQIPQIPEAIHPVTVIPQMYREYLES